MNKIFKTAITAITFAALVWSCSEQPNGKEFTGDFGNENSQYRNTETKNLSPYAIFGDSSFVLMTEEERTGRHSLVIPNLGSGNGYLKIEFELKTGLLKVFDEEGIVIDRTILPPEAFARFLSVDRLASKYADLSPYNYVANNPIRNIDPNGDSIVVVINSAITGANGQQSIQSTRYFYGQDANGAYGFIDPSTGGVYTGNNQFINQAGAALNTLRQNAEGRGLVDGLAFNEPSDIELVQRRSNGADMQNGSYVTWNPNLSTSAPDETGSINRPSYIGLAHELAHIEDIKNGTINLNTWVNLPGGGSIPNAEIYATHRENQIRAENGLSLRAYYGITTTGAGDPSTRIVRNGQSLYYNNLGVTNFRTVKRKNRLTY